MVKQEAQLIRRYHDLAVECFNAVLALHYLRHMGGFRRGRQALAKLREAVQKLPSLPLVNDPFCRQAVVDVVGLQTTSGHAAAFALAERTWNTVQRTVLKPGRRSRHKDESGNAYKRVTSELIRHDPTEGRWSADAWRDVCGRVAELPELDDQKLQAELALEWTHANRRLGEMTLRSGVSDSQPQPRVRSRPKQVRGQGDRKREARDRWIYKKCCEEVPYKTIIAALKAIGPGRGWSIVGTPQGIRWIAAEYANRSDQPEPPLRR